jgi:two-component system LytT family response regulator
MSAKLNRVPIPTDEGFDFVPVEEIVYCQASGNYTQIVLPDQRMLVSRSLKDVEELLSNRNFVRIHHSFIVNLDHLERYVRGSGGTVLVSTGDELPVSKSRKPEFLNSVNGE